jgi:hypothetical protein
LLGIVSNQNNVFPICETLEAIVVTALAGRERRLELHEYQYDFSSSRLLLEQGAITARDRKLTVEVAIHCSKVVR